MGCSLPCAAGSARVRIDAETQNMGLCAVLLLLHGTSAWRSIAVWEGRALLHVSECSPTATSPCAQPRDTAATCLWPLAASLPAPCSATACEPLRNLPKPFKPFCAPMPHANESPAQHNRPTPRTDRWTARRRRQRAPSSAAQRKTRRSGGSPHARLQGNGPTCGRLEAAQAPQLAWRAVHGATGAGVLIHWLESHTSLGPIKAVEHAASVAQSVHHVHDGYGAPPTVLRVAAGQRTRKAELKRPTGHTLWHDPNGSGASKQLHCGPYVTAVRMMFSRKVLSKVRVSS
jgi:hypothetical protein